MAAPFDYYQEQRAIYSGQLAAVAKMAGRVSSLRLWVAIAAIGLGLYAINSGIYELWWLVAGLGAAFLMLVRRHMKLSDEQEGLKVHLFVIDNELLALDGNYNAFADGAQYTDTIHPYSYDLDIFGKHSVYQMVSRAVTFGGEKLLADKFLNLAPSAEKITGQQAIVKELSTQPGLLLKFRVAGIRVKEAPRDQYRLTQWLQSANELIDDKLVTTAAIVMPALALACIGYSLFIGSVFSGLFGVVIVNMILARRCAAKIKLVAQGVGSTAKLISKYEGLLLQVANAEFEGGFLKLSTEKAQQSLAEITNLKKLVNLFDSRSNNMVGPLMNAFFLFNLTCIIRLEKWKVQNSHLLLEAIDAMIAMDAYVSCAVYAFNNPAHIYPAVTTSGKGIHAEGLRHPLLPAKVAVGNDFSLGSEEQFYLLTGANMTGKSTFIRTVGVSIVMFNLGLPLPAASLTLPVVGLYTSMRVTDSVQDDISYFKAELNRIKALMEAVKSAGTPHMVLLDEPLRGTNSTDKQQGTRAIVDNLLGYNAIGIVATHDTILCDMEQVYPGKVSNYHFESRVGQAGLLFDFKLKRGASTSNNATLLMRQMGIIKG